MREAGKKIIRWISLLLSVFLAACAVPVSASVLSDNGIVRSNNCSITMTVNRDEWYVDGSIFRLYKVADLDDDLGLSFTDAFRDCGIDIQPVSITGDLSNTASKWMSTASGLLQYVRDNNIAEDSSAEISNRTMTFSNLSLGLYLIQGDTAKEGNRTVTYQPVVICIPQRSSTTQNWKYNITSQVKSADPTYVSDKTETPAKPSTTVPATPTGTKSTKTKKVKTGDTTNITFYVAAAVVAAAALCLLVRARRRKKH